MDSITFQQNAVDTSRYTDYALAIHKLGFNVLPMRSDIKSTTLDHWKHFHTRRQTEQEVLAMTWGNNIGIINGISDLRSVDLDQCHNVETLFKVLELLGLDYDYPWVVQSPGKGGGFHIYLHCPDELTLTPNGVIVGYPKETSKEEKDPFSQIELRWNKCVTVFPPSIHIETHTPYEWAFGTPETPIATVPLTVVEKAFTSLATTQKKRVETNIAMLTTDTAETATSTKTFTFDTWAQKAFTQELDTLRFTAEGQRNAQLNRSAFNLGQIIGANRLGEQEVRDELARTAATIGLDEKEIESTITSGIAAGRKKPRMPKQVFKDSEPALALPPIQKVDDEKLASFSADDQGHAEAVYSLYGPYIAYNEAYGWLIWNGSHFVPSVQRINTAIINVLRRRQRAAAHLERTDLAKVSKSMAGTVAATRSMLENLAYVPVEEFDSEPDLFNTLNGIVDLRTKTLLPHDPLYRFTWCSPVRYNPHANSSLWLAFLSDTLEKGEMVDYLQEAMGYSITGLISEECLFYIYGPPRSGKGTTTETFMSIIPRPISVEVDFMTFTAKREGDNQNFDLAPLKAARIVFASESNKFQSLNPAKVKALTGGNMVYCSYKHKDMFSYQPQYTVWLSSNHEVNADADDDALWGRVKVIHFPNSRLGSEDKTLKQQLRSPENLEAALAWAIDGAYQWYQRGGKGLDTPQAVKDLTQSQRDAQDSVGLWLEECCELVEGEWTENTKIRTSYENWCEANGYDPKKAKGLSQSLAAHGCEVSVQKRITDVNLKSNILRGVNGLKILNF
jgi:putative DNA primase/helicase